MQGAFEAASDVATGAVIGHAIEGEPGGAHHAAPHGPCLNCGTPLVGEFCHSCGQTAHPHRTLWSIVHELLHGVYHFEGKVWTTLPLLFWKPGSLTRRYIAGERVKFVSPLALFLFSVFLMVATFETIGGPFSPGTSDERLKAQVKLSAPELAAKLKQTRAQLDTVRARQKTLEAQVERMDAAGQDSRQVEAQASALDRQGDKLERDADGLETALNIVNGKGFEEGFLDGISGTKDGKPGAEPNKPEIHINTAIPGLDARIKKAASNPKLFFYKLQSSAYKYSWMLIPISLPFIWLLFFWRRDVGPYDHAIFAIYSLSAMTLGVVGLSVLAAIGVPGQVLGLIFLLGPPLHIYTQLRGAYRLGWFGAAWRTVALLFSALFASITFFLAILNVAA